VANLDYSARTSRSSKILAGLVATILGAAVLLFAALLTWSIHGRRLDTPMLAVLGLALALGLLLFLPGLRLLTGKRRRDGGLFSPWILRFGGLIFFVGPIAMLFSSPSLLTILKVGVSIAAGVACFALANRRAQQLYEQRDREISNHPLSGPR